MAAGASAAAAIAQAIKASGVVVKIDPDEFSKILRLAKDPLIVIAEGGLFGKTYQYMMSYKGLAFFTKSKDALSLPQGAEVVTAKSIWVP
jgi:hypothetical protein